MTLLEAFLFFVKTGFLSIGGGYAAINMIQSQIVDTWGMMTLEEFADLVAIAEMTPGSLTINAATFIGNRMAGLFGAVICTAGYILPAVLMCTVVAWFYSRYRSLAAVNRILAAVRPAVIALMAATALSLVCLTLFQSGVGQIRLENLRVLELLLFLAGLYILRKWKPGPVVIILGTGAVGTLLYLGMEIILGGR